MYIDVLISLKNIKHHREFYISKMKNITPLGIDLKENL